MAKRAAKQSSSETDGEPSKKKGGEKLERKNSTQSDFDKIDFTSEAVSSSKKKWNLKISSWNINGIRAWLGKDGQDYIKFENPDIFCVQETKCSEKDIPPAVARIDGYHSYWSSAEKAGYAGTGLYSKIKPISVTYGLGKEEHDNEGRCITVEFNDFFLVTSYVPNSGRGLPRLQYRTQEWDKDFRKHLKTLDAKKPVIICGDLNVAHKEIDLKNPKTNTKTAGFTKEERESFTKLLDDGFVDTFRHLYPDKEGAFTFWSYMGNARTKNVGWRLDYFIISERLTPKLCDSLTRPDVMGSDHCPVTLLMAM